MILSLTLDIPMDDDDDDEARRIHEKHERDVRKIDKSEERTKMNVPLRHPKAEKKRPTTTFSFVTVDWRFIKK